MQKILENIRGSKNIWFIAVALSLFSMLAVYSSAGSLAFKYQGGNAEYYLFKQATLIGLGFVFMYLAHLVNYKYYSRIAQLMLYTSIFLLPITLLFGVNVNEAPRWLTIPVLSLSFQPSDFAKLALIMYTARILSRKQHIIKDFDRAFRPIILPIIVVCMLIIPANLSTGLVLFLTCLTIMFIGRVSFQHIGMTLGCGIVAFLLYWFVATVTPYKSRIDTWKSRISNFMNPEDGESYQVTQSKIAIANGGLVRLAPGKSLQRNMLPQPYSDYIYAIIIEEYGLLGGVIIMLLYLSLLYQAIQIFARSPGAFGALLAVGLAISLVIQAFMNMAVTVDLLPVTGLTLPFVSMGGTSILFTSIAVGIILSVSRHIEQEAVEQI